MSLATNLQDFATRVATEFKSVRTSIGTLSSLTTTSKTVVGAINEVDADIAALSGSAAGINDGTTSSSSTWSSTKTAAEIVAARDALLGGAGAAYDTLQELSVLINDSATDAEVATLTTAIGNRVRYDAAQSLTAPQALQARSNIGAVAAADVGDTAVNLVATFEAGLL